MRGAKNWWTPPCDGVGNSDAVRAPAITYFLGTLVLIRADAYIGKAAVMSPQLYPRRPELRRTLSSRSGERFHFQRHLWIARVHRPEGLDVRKSPFRFAAQPLHKRPQDQRSGAIQCVSVKCAPSLKYRTARQFKTFEELPSEPGGQRFQTRGAESAHVFRCDVGDVQQIHVKPIGVE